MMQVYNCVCIDAFKKIGNRVIADEFMMKTNLYMKLLKNTFIFVIDAFEKEVVKKIIKNRNNVHILLNVLFLS